MKAKELQDLIEFIAQTGLEEVNIETEAFKIKVKRSSDAIPQVIETVRQATPVALPPAAAAPTPAAAAPVAPVQASPGKAEPAAEDTSHLVEIKSPMIGTFYRSPNPDSDAFVKIGDKVKQGQPVCIVEAMKLFNEIESEVSGTIVKVLVENASPVEYDQPLFLVDPTK